MLGRTAGHQIPGDQTLDACLSGAARECAYIVRDDRTPLGQCEADESRVWWTDQFEPLTIRSLMHLEQSHQLLIKVLEQQELDAMAPEVPRVVSAQPETTDVQTMEFAYHVRCDHGSLDAGDKVQICILTSLLSKRRVIQQGQNRPPLRLTEMRPLNVVKPEGNEENGRVDN